jgi:uncharacterized membrane protein YqiK
MVGIVFGWILVSAGMLWAGVYFHSVMLAGFGIFLLIVAAVVSVYLRLYTKTSASEAFYRTGMGMPQVIIDGGGLVIPLLHEKTRVLLETMKLEVARQGADALICKDFLRVDVAAEFYIRVNKSEEGVKAAATTLGSDATNPVAIKERLFEKLVSAIRTVAATMELNELHQNREEFASRVIEAVTKDIEPNGFILETVTISQLDQTDVKNLKAENVFDAQGLRKATEITQAQMVIKNKIEKQASIQITEENVSTRKRILAQDQDREFAEADQKTEVANRQAEREREIAEFEIAQQQQVETRRVKKEEGIQAAEIQRQARLVAEEQKRETAEVEKEKAIEVAMRERQIAIAEAEGRRAEAEAAQRLAEAKEREAAEKVITAGELEEANREKKKAVIKAEQDGERQLIELQKTADAEAYIKTREALAGKEAAENEAVARIRLAEAALEAKRREAEGEKAVKMVPVEVDRERIQIRKVEQFIPVEVDAKRVEVERQRVEVLRQELEAKDEHQQAAIHLEIAKAQIQASKEVGIAMADSYGKFMERGQFQIYGDPDTLAQMNEKFANGLGISQMLGGLQDSSLLGGLMESGIEAATAGLDAARAKADRVLDEVKNTAGEPASSAPVTPQSGEDVVEATESTSAVATSEPREADQEAKNGLEVESRQEAEYHSDMKE